MTKKLAMSFSRLNTFEQCPAKFDYLYVSKVVKDEMNEASAYGDRVHKALQAYGEGKLQAEKMTLEQKQIIERWGGIVDKLLSATKGRVMFEHRMTIDFDKEKVDWFAKDAYIRAIADLLIIDGDTAYCFDYKTGKESDDDTQLKMFAGVVMFVFPQVQRVKTAYIWLKTNKITTAIYDRVMAMKAWDTIETRINDVYDTVELGFFVTRPSGLCGWCPAKGICPDALRR